MLGEKLNLNPIKPLDLTSSLQEMKTEKHISDTMTPYSEKSGFQETTKQMNQVFQEISGLVRREGESMDRKRLKRHQPTAMYE